MAMRWGIVGAGQITHDFCNALNTLPHQDHQIVAVAARDAHRAKQYAGKFGIAKSYGSYEELAKDSDIDIAYIGVQHNAHFDTSKMMLNNGKHVLCEKPMTMNPAETKELIRLAREKKLFLIEGFWSRFFPTYDKLREDLSLIGDVKLVTAMFASSTDPVKRANKQSGPGGVFYDTGCYLVQLATMIYGCKPEKVTCEGHSIAPGVDENGCIILRYSGGRFAQLTYQSGVTGANNNAQIIGVNGSIELMSPFWCSHTIKTPTGLHEFPLEGGEYPFVFPNSLGFIYEATCVRECIKKEDFYPKHWSLGPILPAKQGLFTTVKKHYFTSRDPHGEKRRIINDILINTKLQSHPKAIELRCIECPLMTHRDSEMIAEVSEEVVRKLGIKN